MFFCMLSGETQKYFLTNYKEAKGRSLVQFWIDSVCDRTVLDLLIPAGFEMPGTRDGTQGVIESNPDTDVNSSGAIGNKNMLNMSGDSLENFDKENLFCEDVMEPTILRDSCVADGTTALRVAGRLGSGSFENLGTEGEYGRVPTLETITQTLKKDSMLRRLEKVRHQFACLLYILPKVYTGDKVSSLTFLASLHFSTRFLERDSLNTGCFHISFT